MAAKEPIDYQTLFQFAPIGMCISQNRVIQACNAALGRMFGYDPHELEGESFMALYPTSDEFERTGARIVPIMSAKGSYSDERIMKRRNKELFWCHVNGRALVATDGLGTGVWTFEDLSEKRTVSAELTAREREIAALLVEGHTSKQIARLIGLSPRTVEMHRAKLMRKFSSSTSSELVHRLMSAGN